MMISGRLMACALLLFSLAQTGRAEQATLTVDQAWSRPTILLNRPGSAYFTIHNPTAREDRLIKATSPLAERVEIHVHKHEDGVMRMVEVDHIPVAAHSTTVVKPGGYHLMLFGLKKKLQLGDELPLVLTFETAGDMEVMAEISQKALVLSGEKKPMKIPEGEIHEQMNPEKHEGHGDHDH